MRIIDNDNEIKIRMGNFWELLELLEGIINKILSILGSGLPTALNFFR